MAAPYSAGSNPRPGTQWSVASPYTGSFVAPSTYLLDVEVRSQIFDAYDERTLYDFLIHSGRTKVSKNTTFRHFEWDVISHIHTIESVGGSAGAGNTAEYTLEEVDHLASGTLSQLKKKDLVLVYTATGVKKGYVVDKVSTTNAHVIHVKPIDTTLDLVTASAAADTIAVFSGASSDGAGMTDPTSRLPVDFYNYIQITDTQKKTDTSESANVANVVVDGKPYFYSQLVIDGDLEHRRKIEGAGIFGQRGSLADPVETSKTAYFTGGLEYWADNEGYAEPYSSAFGLADMKNVCKNLDLERASIKQLMLAGNNVNMDIDDLFKGQTDNTAINWAAMGIGNAASRVLDFGIDGFRYDNRIFMKKKFDVFNYLGMTATSASPYPNMAFTLPWDRVVNPSTQDEEDSICLRYKANDRGSLLNEFWERDQKLTNQYQYEFNWRSNFGFQFALARHINKIYKA